MISLTYSIEYLEGTDPKHALSKPAQPMEREAVYSQLCMFRSALIELGCQGVLIARNTRNQVCTET